MDLILNGLFFGLFLAILLGPIFIVTINGTIQRGKKAGFAITGGVWFIDFLVIILSYFFVNEMKAYLDNPQVKMFLGITGGIIFIIIGIINLRKTINKKDIKGDIFEVEKGGAFAQNLGTKTVFEFFMKGILVNTLNPFTFFFWLTIMSTRVFAINLNVSETILYIGTIFCTIVVTDSLKVILADKIRKIMKPKHFIYFTRIAGVGLLSFGLYFLIYVFYFI